MGVQWPLGEFTGLFAERGQPGYEATRTGRVFNARHPDRYPAAVLLATDDADLVAGVRWARERGLRVSVRAGGHSWAVWSVRDDALLIDLGELRDMRYDPGTEVAAVRPAVRGGTELAPFLASRGRAFPGGHCESVGLGGYLLQGGQGWNGRIWGWACENVLGIDAVTADGRLVHADQTENADLYWAARGAGPGFPALVTRFYLRTYPKPPVMVQDTWTFPLDEAGPLLAWLHEILPGLHRSVEPVVAATRLPGVPLDDGVRQAGRHGAAAAHDGDGGLRGGGGGAAGRVRRGPAGWAAARARPGADHDRCGERGADAAEPGRAPVHRGLHLE